MHVVHIAHEGLTGMFVGQAHLLDDLISLVCPVYLNILLRPSIKKGAGKVFEAQEANAALTAGAITLAPRTEFTR